MDKFTLKSNPLCFAPGIIRYAQELGNSDPDSARRIIAAWTEDKRVADAVLSGNYVTNDDEVVVEVMEKFEAATHPVAYIATTASVLDEIEEVRSPDGRLAEGSRFFLMPGDYYLLPVAHVDSTCGNCEDPNVPVEATVGLIISGLSYFVSLGARRQPAIIRRSASATTLFATFCPKVPIIPTARG